MNPSVCRIFISSPGDVAAERERAKQVVEGIRKRYAGRLSLQTVLWEDLPLQVDMSFQEGIDLVLSGDRGIDIAVFILWGRLGTPLGANFRKADGSSYRSGTEREFDLMLQALDRSGGKRPRILAYVRSDDASFHERLRGLKTNDQEELILQKRLVESFIEEEFRDKDSGLNLRAYHRFNQPTGFSQRLRAHLQELLDPIAGEVESEPIWDIGIRGSPFRGIEPFEFEHSTVYFGREDEELEVRQAFAEQARSGCAFVLILGASGSGKSSLARAGVLPSISANEVDDTIAEWRRVIFTPAELGENPYGGFVEKLREKGAFPEEFEDPQARSLLAEALREDPKLACSLSLVPAIRKTRPVGKVRLIVLADQLEEFFTAGEKLRPYREPFFGMLEELSRSGVVWVLATLRSDFYAQAQKSETLARMRGSKGGVDLSALRPDSVRRMIEEPARLSNLKWEKIGERSLSAAILNDTAGHGEWLPLLQYLLQELYEQRDADDRLCFHAYEKLGGVRGALCKRAEQVIDSLSPGARAQFGNVVRQIATVDPGEGSSFARRWADYEELARSPEVREFLDAFLDKRARLFVTRKAEDDGGRKVVSVAHEALLTAWDRLHEWLKENKLNLKARMAISEDARRWMELGENRDYLYREGSQLRESLELLAEDYLEAPERRFVEASAACSAELALAGSLRGGENLIEISGRTRVGHPEVWRRVLRATMREGTEGEQRNATVALAGCQDSELMEELIGLAGAAREVSVRNAAARSLVLRGEPAAFASLVDAAFPPGGAGGKSSARIAARTLAMMLASAEMQNERPPFIGWFAGLPAPRRALVRIRSWAVRWRAALPVFVFVVLPAMFLAFLGAASVKWLPSLFNYSCVQATASAFMGLFHSGPAGIVIGGGTVFGLTLYRMVFGREYGRFSMLRPGGALVFGALSGFIGGIFCVMMILGVYDASTLNGMGWVDAEIKPSMGALLARVFGVTRDGLPFPLTSLGAGLGMAMMANGLRASPRWKAYVDRQTSIRSLKQAGGMILALIRLSLPLSFPIPLFVTLFAAAGLAFTSPSAPSGEQGSVLLGGIERVSPGNHGKEEKLKLERDAIAKRIAWKKSLPGRVLGVSGDSLAKVVGGYFSIVGMGLGIIAMRHGIYVEPRKAS